MRGDGPEREREPHRERAEQDLHGEQASRQRQRPPDGVSRACAGPRSHGERGETERDAARQRAVRVLEGDANVHARRDRAEAERPVRAGQPGAVRAHQRPEHDQRPGEPREQREAEREALGTALRDGRIAALEGLV